MAFDGKKASRALAAASVLAFLGMAGHAQVQTRPTLVGQGPCIDGPIDRRCTVLDFRTILDEGLARSASDMVSLNSTNLTAASN